MLDVNACWESIEQLSSPGLWIHRLEHKEPSAVSEDSF